MLNPQQLKKLVRTIMATRHDELSCETCFQELDRFVEISLAGMDAAEAMPLVQHHLELCQDCGEEFHVLLEALRALQTPSSQNAAS